MVGWSFFGFFGGFSVGSLYVCFSSEVLDGLLGFRIRFRGRWFRGRCVGLVLFLWEGGVFIIVEFLKCERSGLGVLWVGDLFFFFVLGCSFYLLDSKVTFFGVWWGFCFGCFVIRFEVCFFRSCG